MDLIAKGYVETYVYEEVTFTLMEAQKVNDKVVLRACTYTPDYVIKPAVKAYEQKVVGHIGDKEAAMWVSYNGLVYVDVKGTTVKWGSDHTFPVKQKWLYDKYKIFTNKVQVSGKNSIIKNTNI